MYKKILIKSEEDLPEEEDLYFCCNKRLVGGLDAQIYLYEKKQFWLENIDWYLIESPISVPTEEEIEKYILTIKRPEELNTIDYYCTGINAGAKWAIDEIIKRNK